MGIWVNGLMTQEMTARSYAETNSAPTRIEKVGLDDIGDSIANGILETALTGFLLAESDRDFQGIFDFLRGIEIVERTRLLKKRCANIFQHVAHFDCMRRVVGTVRVRMDHDLLHEFLARQW